MPSVKIPKKSTHVDMTPFVDVAFLILTFFIMATKFKPPEPVEVTTPNSVSTKDLEEKDAIMVTLDKEGKVYFSMFSEKDPSVFRSVIENMNTTRNLGLTAQEMANFSKTAAIGVPIAKLKSLLSVPPDEHKNIKMEGIPVDSANNELKIWIRDAINAFSGKKLNLLIKGDNAAKYPSFKNVLKAFTENDQYKFNLITMPEDAPLGSELYNFRQKEQKNKSAEGSGK